nr:hypothetical protein [Tanacetum cinerariifolium]
MLGIVGGGIGASPDVVIVAMVKGIIIGVGVSRDTIEEDVIVKIDSTPTSLIGFNMLDTNDDIDELSCVLGIRSKFSSSSSLVSSSSLSPLLSLTSSP